VIAPSLDGARPIVRATAVQVAKAATRLRARGHFHARVAILFIGVSILAYAQAPTIWAARAEWKNYYPGRIYTGALPTYYDDTSSYWSWMRQAREGSFFFTDLYTPEEHPRNYVNLLFWTMGSISRVTGVDVQVVYIASRIVFGAALLWMLAALAGALFRRPGERVACFLMLLLAGGWEGTAAFLERHLGAAHVSSPAWWTPEMSTFFSMMLFPHFVAGFLGMLGAILLTLRAWREPWTRGAGAGAGAGAGTDPASGADAGATRRRLGYAIATGLVLFTVTFFHPYDVVTIMATLYVAPLFFAVSERRWPWREWTHSLIATAIWIPAFLYNWWIFVRNPAMRWWDLQNIMITPDPLRLAIALGLNGILAAFALFAFRRMGRAHLVMLAWLASTLVIIHLPLRFQRRTIGGIQFPLAAIAMAGLVYVVLPPLMTRTKSMLRDWGHRTALRTATGLGIGTLAFTVLLVPLQAATPYYLRDIEWSALRTVRYPAWLRTEDFVALHALEKITPPDAIVLSSYEIGNFVPPYSGRRCFLGHYALTMDAQSKRADVERFFSSDASARADAWRLDLLRLWRIGYVLDTPFERALGAFDPATKPWLERIYVTGKDPQTRAAVYRVRLP
jgi:hypothetical protein